MVDRAIKIGSVVRISMPLHGRYCIGEVVEIDGFDVYVKLNYKGVIVHRLINEIKDIKNG